MERQLEVTGRDGFRFAQLLTPRDLSKCAVGQGKYVLITAPDGGIVNDPVMLRLGENHFWFALASSDALLYASGPGGQTWTGMSSFRSPMSPRSRSRARTPATWWPPCSATTSCR